MRFTCYRPPHCTAYTELQRNSALADTSGLMRLARVHITNLAPAWMISINRRNSAQNVVPGDTENVVPSSQMRHNYVLANHAYSTNERCLTVSVCWSDNWRLPWRIDKRGRCGSFNQNVFHEVHKESRYLRGVRTALARILQRVWNGFDGASGGWAPKLV
ncbi:hypothetical protein CPB85DRAFT_651292 [Mucidula mucida]|nr:hypothetical protein CPB85DRAFT_651292 [Mucidula mucida]